MSLKTRNFIVLGALVLGVAMSLTYQGCKSFDGVESPVKKVEFDSREMNGNGNGAGYGGKIEVGQYYNLSDTDDCQLNGSQAVARSFIDSFIDVRPSGEIMFYNSCNAENGTTVSRDDLDIDFLFQGIIKFRDNLFEKYDEPPHMGDQGRVVGLYNILQFDSQIPSESNATLRVLYLQFRRPFANSTELWLQVSYRLNTYEYTKMDFVLLAETVNQDATIYRSPSNPVLELVLEDNPPGRTAPSGRNGQLEATIEGIQIDTAVQNLRIYD